MIMEWTKFPLFVIAGPCVIESEELCMTVAGEVKRICAKLGVGYVFKASFDKANRSSSSSYRGPGLVEGVAILKRVKEKQGVAVLTDVHETEQVEEVALMQDLLNVVERSRDNLLLVEDYMAREQPGEGQDSTAPPAAGGPL